MNKPLHYKILQLEICISFRELIFPLKSLCFCAFIQNSNVTLKTQAPALRNIVCAVKDEKRHGQRKLII